MKFGAKSMKTFSYDRCYKGRVTKLYGYGVCDAYGNGHCIGRCQDPKDCGARPIPIEDVPELKQNIV